MLLENTEIPVEKTLGQLQRLLCEAGAAAVLVEYMDRKPAAVKFQIETPSGRMAFELPARVAGVTQALQEKRSWRTRGTAETLARDGEQAERIAWRQLHRWVEAQLALVQLQMADVAEVFLPYALTPEGRTLYAEVRDRGLNALLPAHEGI